VLKVCQCVKNFSPVGGMEGYVWNLTHELIEQNIKVVVICEKYHKHYNSEIEIKLIENKKKITSSWVNHLIFSAKVEKLIKQNEYFFKNYIIHSHERLNVHHITTLHGPLILDRRKRIFDFFSLRLFFWKILEKRELSSSNVTCIVPNSNFTRDKVKFFYPQIKSAICYPGYPGVKGEFYQIPNKSEVFNFGFIGKEWKRKGLLFALEVYKEVYKIRPDIHLHIAGVEINAVKSFLVDMPEHSYTFYGWTESKVFFEKIEVLLHPALNEPYGMVASEANASGVFCLISKYVGFKDFIETGVGEVLDLDKKQWVDAILKLIGKKIPVKRINFSWQELTSEYIKLYAMLDNLHNN